MIFSAEGDDQVSQESGRLPIRDVIKTILLYAIPAAGSLVIAGEIGKLWNMNLMFVSNGVIAWCVLLMAAELVKMFVQGGAVARLVALIRNLSYVIGVYLILEGWPTGGPVISVSLPFLTAGTSITLYWAAKPFLESRSPLVLRTFADIALVVVLAFSTLTAISSLGLGSISMPIGVGGTYFHVKFDELLVAGSGFAIISLAVRSLRGSGNTILNATGKSFPKTATSFVVGSSFALYVLELRPTMLRLQPNFEIGEWVILCLAVAFVYLKLRGQLAPEPRELQLAEWKRHIQVIDTTKDRHFEDVVRIIDGFIQDSRKDQIVLYLAYALAQRSVPRQMAEIALAELINYSSPQTDQLLFSWDTAYVSNTERAKRLEVMRESLKTIDRLMYTRTTGANTS